MGIAPALIHKILVISFLKAGYNYNLNYSSTSYLNNAFVPT